MIMVLRNLSPIAQLFWLILVFLNIQDSSQAAPSRATLNIGAAEIDITPPVGHRMAGYFDERLSTGVHDPLKAKAIVVQQGQEQIAMVFCDLVGFALNFTTNARAQASRLTGFPVSQILISARHRHT